MAIVLGVGIFFISMIIIQIGLDYLYPFENSSDFRKKELIVNHLASTPKYVLLGSILIRAIFCYLAVLIGIKIAESEHAMIGYIIIAVILFITFGILMSVPHPWWYSILSIILYPLAGYLAMRFNLKNGFSKG